jgi:hypothetical protein
MKHLKLMKKRELDKSRIIVLSEPARCAGSSTEGTLMHSFIVRPQIPHNESHHTHRLYRSACQTAATQSGKGVTRFSLATTKRYQQDAEWKEKTYWHDCVAYGGYASFAAKLKQGTHVVVEGELTYREYNRAIETESGAINVLWPVTEIVVDSITVLDRRRKENNPSEDAA